MGLSWPEVLARLSRREALTATEAEETLGVVLAGDATPAQVGAFLTLLHAKGETADEVTGLARAMLDAAVPCPLGVDEGTVVVDLVGTGGDRLASFNVTTLAALIVAGSGVPVCKHGNRAASSAVGTADVLEVRGDGTGAFELHDWRVDPAQLGLGPATLADLRGGDATFNAGVIRSVLEGEQGARRDIGVLNAAAALVVAGRVEDVASGLEVAAESVDSGRAAKVLDAMVATSQAARRQETG